MKTCEEMLIQKMALVDGEKTESAVAEIDAHLAACEDCRREFEELEQTAVFLRRQMRQTPDADLWSAVASRLGGKAEASSGVGWQPFFVLGVFLVVYKLVEMVPERDLGWALKLAPLALIAALFALTRENPFKINTELIPEK